MRYWRAREVVTRAWSLLQTFIPRIKSECGVGVHEIVREKRRGAYGRATKDVDMVELCEYF